ncbi:MAG: DUF433 domain-containing protein [Egibacteraceae bacterium]
MQASPRRHPVPVSALFPYLRRGHTVEQILNAFPQLEEADVEAAPVSWR